MVNIDHCVPESMQLIHIVVVFQQEIIATSIASRELLINSVETMEWLVNISHKMDKQSNGNRSCISIIVVLGNGGVSYGALITGLVFEPTYEVSDDLCDVLRVLTSPFGVVRYCTTFIQKRSIDVVPVRLP